MRPRVLHNIKRDDSEPEVRKVFRKKTRLGQHPENRGQTELQAGVCKPARLGDSQQRHKLEMDNAKHSPVQGA